MRSRPLAAGFFWTLAVALFAGFWLTVAVVIFHFISKFW